LAQNATERCTINDVKPDGGPTAHSFLYPTSSYDQPGLDRIGKARSMRKPSPRSATSTGLSSFGYVPRSTAVQPPRTRTTNSLTCALKRSGCS